MNAGRHSSDGERFNNFARQLVPNRITGMIVRIQGLIYFVEWTKYGYEAYGIEASKPRPPIIIAT